MSQTNYPSAPFSRSRSSRYRVRKIAWLLLSLLLLFVVPSLILLGLLMLPTLGALVTDRRPEKYATTCVGGFNLTASLPYLFKLWEGGGGPTALILILQNVWMWLITYSVAAIAWGIFWLIPETIVRFSNWHSKDELKHLQSRKQELLDEWGVDIVQAIEEDKKKN